MRTDHRSNLEMTMSQFSRRQSFAVILGGVALTANRSVSRSACAVEAGKNAKVALEKSVRIKSILEVKGNVLLRDLRGKKASDTKSVPIEAKSELELEESYQSNGNGNGISLQEFRTANLENQIDKHVTKLMLNESCRQIVKQSSSQGMITTCLNHPLTAGERDLVEGPIATMYIDQLMPTHKVSLGESWLLDIDVAKSFFQLDVVRNGELKVTLIDANEKEGQLELTGKFSGEVGGIGTKLSISGKATIDRAQKIVNWLALAIQEDREVSEAAPGFSIQARLRIRRDKLENLTSGEQLESFASQIAKLDPTAQLIQFDSKAGAYRFVADRHWTTILDNGVDATLKLIQDNKTTAYCTITNLADMEPGRQLSLEGFQSDIKKTLGNKFGSFIEADERLSQTGLRMMRVVAIGQVEEVPVHWINILLSNDGGRHVSLAYTMNQSKAEAFGTQDLQMAGSLEFSMRQLPAAPEEKKEESENKESTAAAAKSNNTLRK
jgi:hypothetical protein